VASPKKKNLSRFLGLHGDKQQQPLPETPPQSGLVKTSLSSSTPMVLESCDNDDIYHSVSETRWQSNDGLLTPGSVGGMSPFCRSPEASPTHDEKPAKTTADKGVMTSDLDDAMSAAFYGGCAYSPWQCPCQSQRPAFYGTASATSSPFHTAPRGGAAGRGRAASVGRSQMSPLQRGGLGTISRARGVHMAKRLPRSMTLDDLDPQQFVDVHHGHHQLHHQLPFPQQQPAHSRHFWPQQSSQMPLLQSPMCAPPMMRMSRRESLGYDPCLSACQFGMSHHHSGKD
jgi:hypothetical protein